MTTEACTLGVIKKDVYIRYKRDMHNFEARDLFEFFKPLPQFSHWRKNTLICFASMMRRLKVNEGAEVVTPEERGSNFIMIRSGTFEVSQILQREHRLALPISKASRVYKHSSTED